MFTSRKLQIEILLLQKADMSSKCGLSNKSNAVRAEVIDKAKKKLLEVFGILVHEPQNGEYG